MTLEQWEARTTQEQRTAMRNLAQRYRIPLGDLVERATPPTDLSPWVGIEIQGIYHGIEPDGYTHT